MLRYPVSLKRDTNGTVRVEFPDVPEAHTFGEDVDEALMQAVDALESALSLYIDARRDIPQPSSIYHCNCRWSRQRIFTSGMCMPF